MQTEIAIAGAGLAAAVLALRLSAAPGAPRIALHDPQPFAGRTWSFHEHDVTEEDRRWLSPAIAHRWSGQDVRFPGLHRTMRAGYATITPESLAAALPPNVTIRPGRIADPATLDARCVIDARGAAPHPALRIAFQKFLGQEVRLHGPHGLTRPVIMDAEVAQLEGFRFVYVLPLSPTTLLIEDTRYSDTPEVDAAAFRSAISAYAAAQGWRIADVLREESAALPLGLAFDAEAFWADAALPRIGMAAAQFHPVTGYTLPDAVRTANLVAAHWTEGTTALARHLRRDALRRARGQRFYRLLSRMLFEAATPDARWRVLRRFYGLPEPLIERFYAGRTTTADMARILVGRPPVPLGRALRSLPERMNHV
ncbi:lycopene beta-cyclase CrtY [Falsirhodobacter algicola]|uniref:Lycopene beta-cyclase CrtY n=1 Tax=Falsirhodobacter algicola TaxID=2692330 RepID=A0A8J8MS83_9RHOB|nr:lycopene beta-cyclase CrtY [Falsirhodobacter algicola]QUS35822.1 lycopene beta-cyclase CrtY [Falsirhodobacter algicola]